MGTTRQKTSAGMPYTASECALSCESFSNHPPYGREKQKFSKPVTYAEENAQFQSDACAKQSIPSSHNYDHMTP